MMSKTVVLAVALALNLGQCSWGQHEGTPLITGTITYRQRSALPPDAVVVVQLQDVSRQDAPAKIVAEVKIPTAGKQVPIPFRVPYAAAEINPAHRYAVRATITAAGHMIFTSNTSYSVITRGAPTEVKILVQPVTGVSSPKERENHTATHFSQTATFVGDFPCTDCSGDRVTLTLFPNGTFRSRLTHEGATSGKDASVYDLGHWSVEKDSARLVLRGGKEAPEQFAIRTRIRFGSSTVKAMRSFRSRTISSSAPLRLILSLIRFE